VAVLLPVLVIVHPPIVLIILLSPLFVEINFTLSQNQTWIVSIYPALLIFFKNIEIISRETISLSRENLILIVPL